MNALLQAVSFVAWILSLTWLCTCINLPQCFLAFWSFWSAHTVQNATFMAKECSGIGFDCCKVPAIPRCSTFIMMNVQRTRTLCLLPPGFVSRACDQWLGSILYCIQMYKNLPMNLSFLSLGLWTHKQGTPETSMILWKLEPIQYLIVAGECTVVLPQWVPTAQLLIFLLSTHSVKSAQLQTVHVLVKCNLSQNETLQENCCWWWVTVPCAEDLRLRRSTALLMQHKMCEKSKGKQKQETNNTMFSTIRSYNKSLDAADCQQTWENYLPIYFDNFCDIGSEAPDLVMMKAWNPVQVCNNILFINSFNFKQVFMEFVFVPPCINERICLRHHV